MKNNNFLTLLLLITLGFITSGSIAVQGASEWTLQIDGSVSHPTVLTLNDLMAMPRTVVPAELYCYGVLVTSGNWGGVRLRFILEKVEFDQKAISVWFYAEDGYALDISITDAMREDVIIAYEKNGELLPETLRLVLPKANGERWIAMITHITVSTDVAAPSSDPPRSTDINPLPVQQQSSTPQPSPAPQSTSIPTPQSQPTPSPSPAPSLSPPTAHPNPEPFPITWTVTAVATVAVASAGLIVYSKKRNH